MAHTFNEEWRETISAQILAAKSFYDPENFGDKLPGSGPTGTSGETAYSFKERIAKGEDPDYQHNKVYYNYDDGQFYTFNGSGNGSFHLVTLDIGQ